MQVACDGGGLVGGDGEDVGEAAARGEAGYGGLLVLADVGACGEESGPYGGNIRACYRKVWRKYLARVAEAAVLVAVAGGTSDTRVP